MSQNAATVFSPSGLRSMPEIRKVSSFAELQRRGKYQYGTRWSIEEHVAALMSGIRDAGRTIPASHKQLRALRQPRRRSGIASSTRSVHGDAVGEGVARRQFHRRAPRIEQHDPSKRFPFSMDPEDLGNKVDRFGRTLMSALRASKSRGAGEDQSPGDLQRSVMAASRLEPACQRPHSLTQSALKR